MTDIIYLDHAAATPIDTKVLAAMQPYLQDFFYNPSSPYRPALAVRREYEAAKESIARSIGAKADELIMTAGATESINLAFSGVRGHVVTTTVEHDAVLRAAETGPHTIVPVDKHGRVSAQDILRAVTDSTELISVQLANNELGTIQPIRDISAGVRDIIRLRKETGNATPLYLHCDASQGAGYLELHVARLGVDLLTLNSGKIYGPKQVGCLWVYRGVQLTAQIVGGGQERGMRSGTENVAGVIGFAEALRQVTKNHKTEGERIRKLRDAMQKKLESSFPEAVLSGHKKYRLPNFLHVSFPGVDAERLVFRLESRGVMVATGSACAANKGTRSHVLEAIGLEDTVADGSLRLTLGHLSDDDTITRATTILTEEIKAEYDRMRK